MKAKPYTTFKNPFEMSRYIDLDKIPFVVGFDAETGEEIRLVTKKQLDELPTDDVVEVKKGEVLMPITKEELAHLMNDTIAYIWRLEERKCDKEEFGYFSRKELLEKLKQFEKEHFPELNTSPCG